MRALRPCPYLRWTLRALRIPGAVLAVLLVVAAVAAPATAAPAPAKLKRATQRVVSAGVPAVVVLVRDGGKTARVARGLADLETSQPVRARDRFRVGSITKSFVATVVVQLAAEGRLGLDDSLERWLPGAVPNGQAITVRHLLGMRSGLFDYIEDPQVLAPYLGGDFGFTWTPEELIAVANTHPPLFAPGTDLAYSNTNYILLGRVIEAATGRPLGVELSERIFEPLNLRSTFFATEPPIPPPYAHGYLFTGGPPVDVTELHPSYAGAAGAVVSTARDTARFYRALFTGRLVRPDLVAAMQTLTTPGAYETPPGFVGYGLGLFGVQTRCGTRWGHEGGIAGYVTSAFSTKRARRQFVIFTNAYTEEGTVGDEAALRALQRLVATAACARLR